MKKLLLTICFIFVASVCFSQGINPTLTVLMLEFDEVDGATTTTDIATGGDAPHSITLSGNAQTDSGIVKGSDFGNSLLLDGTNDLAQASDSDDWDILGDKTTEQTVDAWVRLDVNNRVQTFIGHTGGGLNYWWLYYWPLGIPDGFKFNSYDGTNNYLIISGTLMNVDTWYHICLIKVDDDLGLYLDGVWKGTDSMDGLVINFTGNLDIGDGGTFNDAADLDGNIDEVRITQENYFSVDPTSNTSSFTPPTVAYSVASTRNRFHIVKKIFTPLKRGGYDRKIESWTQNFGWNGIQKQLSNMPKQTDRGLL